MCGHRLANLVTFWENGDHLKDADLLYLIRGIRMLTVFFLMTHQGPMHGYYIQQLLSMESAMNNRRDAKKHKKRH